ncbi:MAG TPA: ABC transporter ATP-binding protein, partial [Polyangiales bacterium]|nr:ABC transporter ATP-binding protein [Polyangiales bacterium]
MSPSQPAGKRKSLPPDAKGRTEAALRAFHEEGTLGAAYDARLLKRLWPFMRPYQAFLWLSIGLGVVMAGMSLLRPYIMRLTIDKGAL